MVRLPIEVYTLIVLAGPVLYTLGYRNGLRTKTTMRDTRLRTAPRHVRRPLAVSVPQEASPEEIREIGEAYAGALAAAQHVDPATGNPMAVTEPPLDATREFDRWDVTHIPTGPPPRTAWVPFGNLEFAPAGTDPATLDTTGTARF